MVLLRVFISNGKQCCDCAHSENGTQNVPGIPCVLSNPIAHSVFTADTSDKREIPESAIKPGCRLTGSSMAVYTSYSPLALSSPSIIRPSCSCLCADVSINIRFSLSSQKVLNELASRPASFINEIWLSVKHSQLWTLRTNNLNTEILFYKDNT